MLHYVYNLHVKLVIIYHYIYSFLIISQNSFL